MSSKFDSYQKRRLQSSYFSVVISIALVLFMVGILGLILLKSTKVANIVKEQVAITLFLKDEVTQKQINVFLKFIQEEPFTNKAIYISKEDAAKIYSEEIGEDFLEFLGKNPLKNGIDLYLKAEFVTPEKMLELEQKYLKNTFVTAVSYDKPLINLLTENIKRVSFWLLVISSFFGIIAIILINSAIRLTIYSKRFTIKTMQMVGATKSFIRKPFILTSIKLGMMGALLAFIGLGFVVYYIDKYIPSLLLLEDYPSLIFLFLGVIFTSFLITLLSTFFATQRFLNLKTDELYY
ncbi:MAG: ABC transporter permease [Flavobacteriia bacterium]|nr:ABC transporter permease [Flavobacteriia bacterium]OIP46437.1 MAG: cell division protein FtsX [Flavobacteriaceae bacterium CG2_30_31_66]PIV96546.1 MAG: cell division protein FtsX [Flavobacteriaceae bacterium CG17_big_fil_post_rev_8_21_14_2_50_31_13]PIX12439.1 MAG: cell division protein FtsX [Flavobacteriaceae bacterium CG_4_8_14_3_um_filter_31_8]PIY16068.1 MAG: cell division protein FtsX [Flavobacteriaceae bacterium CG_4_10_14_3_um_filter_31_253]PIZ09917.1 MAG: cell division protein FtsX [F